MENREDRHSNIKTLVREGRIKTESAGYVILGLIFLFFGPIVGFAAKSFGLGAILFCIGFFLFCIAVKIEKKAEHVSWTMEAMERAGYTKSTYSQNSFTICASCKTNNSESASCCKQCGRFIRIKCPKCGKSNENTAQCCEMCGTPLVSAKIETEKSNLGPALTPSSEVTVGVKKGGLTISNILSNDEKRLLEILLEDAALAEKNKDVERARVIYKGIIDQFPNSFEIPQVQQALRKLI